LSEDLPEVLIWAYLLAGIGLREEVIGDAGETELVVEAAEAGRNTGLAGEIR
jgi:hypothetical protein